MKGWPPVLGHRGYYPSQERRPLNSPWEHPFGLSLLSMYIYLITRLQPGFQTIRSSDIKSPPLFFKPTDILGVCRTLNLAILPKSGGKAPTHFCSKVLTIFLNAHLDLLDQHLADADQVWFTDGNSNTVEGKHKAGYVITSLHEVTEAWALPQCSSP